MLGVPINLGDAPINLGGCCDQQRFLSTGIRRVRLDKLGEMAKYIDLHPLNFAT